MSRKPKEVAPKKNLDILEQNIGTLCDEINNVIRERASATYNRDTSWTLNRKVQWVCYKGRPEYYQAKIDECNKQLQQLTRTLIHRQEELKELRGEE